MAVLTVQQVGESALHPGFFPIPKYFAVFFYDDGKDKGKPPTGAWRQLTGGHYRSCPETLVEAAMREAERQRTQTVVMAVDFETREVRVLGGWSWQP